MSAQRFAEELLADSDTRLRWKREQDLTLRLRAVVGEVLTELGIHQRDDATSRLPEIFKMLKLKEVLVDGDSIRISCCVGYEGFVRDTVDQLLP